MNFRRRKPDGRRAAGNPARQRSRRRLMPPESLEPRNAPSSSLPLALLTDLFAADVTDGQATFAACDPALDDRHSADAGAGSADRAVPAGTESELVRLALHKLHSRSTHWNRTAVASRGATKLSSGSLSEATVGFALEPLTDSLAPQLESLPNQPKSHDDEAVPSPVLASPVPPAPTSTTGAGSSGGGAPIAKIGGGSSGSSSKSPVSAQAAQPSSPAPAPAAPVPQAAAASSTLPSHVSVTTSISATTSSSVSTKATALIPTVAASKPTTPQPETPSAPLRGSVGCAGRKAGRGDAPGEYRRRDSGQRCRSTAGSGRRCHGPQRRDHRDRRPRRANSRRTRGGRRDDHRSGPARVRNRRRRCQGANRGVLLQRFGASHVAHRALHQPIDDHGA